MNGLKHGERAHLDQRYEVMRALGEDPEKFEALKRELAASFAHLDPLWQRQVEDLALLHWRRGRLERAQESLLCRARLAVQERQRWRRKLMEGDTFTIYQAIETQIPEPRDPDVRLRLQLSILNVIREQVRERAFHAWQASEVEYFYRQQGGWRPARLRRLLGVFRERAGGRVREQSVAEDLTPALEAAQYQELRRLLDEEIVGVEEEFEYAEKLKEERAAMELEGCFVPAGEEWKMLLRREEALDRAIDRKVRLLLALQKNSAATSPPGSGDGEGEAGGLKSESKQPERKGSEPVAVEEAKSDDRSGNVEENRGLGSSGEAEEALAVRAGGPDVEGEASRPAEVVV